MCEDKVRKVFLDDLPRKYGIGANKDKQIIDWINSVGYKVKFIYNDIKGEIEILERDERNLTLKYNDRTMKMTYGSFAECHIGKLIGERTDEFKIEIGTRFKDGKRDITIIDRKYIKNKNGENKKYYKYKCNDCVYSCCEHYRKGEYENEYWISEGNLSRGDGCVCCSNKITVPSINDIPTTTPWMVEYFQGGYDEAKRYTKSSGQKIYPRCPDCGRVKNKPIKINDLYMSHSIGCLCGDGKSYPEKFSYELFKQLNLSFQAEYTPNWIKPKRYDSYFEYNNKKYIIEMDGKFHKEDNSMSGQTKEKSKAIDNYKDKLAEEHGIKVIRINCEFSELEFIKNNILKSELNNMFDLSNIDWNRCEEFALSNLVKKICEYWNNKEEWETVKDLRNIFKLHGKTIRNYLKKGTKLGWCYYSAKEETLKTYKKISKPVEIFNKQEISLGIFPSAYELERQSEELFGIKLSHSSISKVCAGTQKLHKGFTFKYNLFKEVN